MNKALWAPSGFRKSWSEMNLLILLFFNFLYIRHRRKTPRNVWENILGKQGGGGEVEKSGVMSWRNVLL